MKKLLLILLFITGYTNAQIVNIPDAYFKAYLLKANINITIAKDVNGNYMKIDANSNNEIENDEALSVAELYITGMGDKNLEGLESFTNLTVLSCSSSGLTSFDVSPFVKLKSLSCYNNQLTYIDLTGLLNLTSLDISNNAFASLNLTSLVNLSFLDCSRNTLTSLDLTSLVNLSNLDCSRNVLTSLDLTSLVKLGSLDCSRNALTYLDLTSLVKLGSLNCSFNQLITLDVTSLENPGLKTFDCRDNQLETLFLKNNAGDWGLNFTNNPNLIYICADEFQIDSVQSKLDIAGLTNTVVNSYCSFNPGGIYNTITGKVRFDANANGCNTNDAAFKNLKITIDDGTTTGTMFGNSLGVYKTYVQETNITITPSVENPNYFIITPSSVALNTLEVNGITQTQDFCVTANGVHNDVEIVVLPLGGARPGENVLYKIVFKNKGNQSLSGDINLTFDDTILDYVSANVNPDSQAEGNLKWNYTYLQPFETRSFTVTLNLNSPQEIPAVNDGDVLSLYVTINPVSGDELPNDNMFELNQTVVNSLDPNDITCLEGNTVSPTEIGDYLHYNINFENIGSASAINIVVKDIIDVEKFDVSTLQVLNMSHTMNTKITDNKVEFIFEDINLEAKEHGNVTYKIKTKSTLQTGDSVLSKADIFFDYNFPIATNDEITTFQALSNTEFVLDNSIRIYPNPANEFVNIKANDTIKSIQLYDFQGRIIKTSLIKDNQSKFDISTYSSGIYFIKVQTNEGIKVEKLMKK